ncbi:MAG: hypothetical protein Q9187_005162 [Circinaria calcarea]
MAKRKRGDPDGIYGNLGDLEARELRQRQRHLEGVIDNGKKSVFRALKLGRGFERQKMGRRQKLAREKHVDKDIKRMDAEIVALKNIDLSAIAELHIYRSLMKTKPVAASPIFPRYIAAKVEVSSIPYDVAHANVTARLYNSNPVREAMADLMMSVRAVLGLEEEKLYRTRLRAADFGANGNGKGSDNALPSGAHILGKQENQGGHMEPAWDGFGDSDVSPTNNINTDEEDEPDYGQFASRLASSSSSEDAFSDGENFNTTANAFRQASHNSLSDRSLSPSQSPSSSGSTPPSNRLETSKSRTTAALKSTTFLPSLMMGGYISGSDSDFVEDAHAADIQPRKNRMGQQARRALAEKKYGQKANHLKNEHRAQGWDPRRGAQGADGRGKRGRGRGGSRMGSRSSRREAGQRGASGANSDPVHPRTEKKPKAMDGPLHPSWEAAKKAKEQKKTVVFEGKKTVFD